MRKGRAAFADFGHGQKEADVQGEILYLKEPYDHRPFSKGWADWLDRHNNWHERWRGSICGAVEDPEGAARR